MLTEKNKNELVILAVYGIFLIMAIGVFVNILEPYMGKMDHVVQVHVDGITMANSNGLDNWLMSFSDGGIFKINNINELGVLHPLVQLHVTLFYMTLRDISAIAFIWSLGYVFITYMSLNFNKQSVIFKLIVWIIRITFMIMLTKYYGIGFTVLSASVYYLVLLPTVVEYIIRPAMEGILEF